MREGGEDPRYEFKLKLLDGTAADIEPRLRWFPDRFRRSFPPRRVNTIYFDTPDLACFSASVLGLFERYKLRLRWYGDQAPNQVWMEWKSRRGGLGSKRRIPIPWSGPLAGREWRQVRELLRTALPDGLRPSFSSTSVPTVFNCYQRSYLESSDHRCRVTIDERLRHLAPPGVRTVRLDALIPRPGVIIEVKVRAQDREAAAAVIRGLKLRPVRCSKYAEALTGL